MEPSLDDAALVARCKRELPHQQAGFEQLVRRHKDMVFTLCYRLVGNAATAEDVAQEVFTKVFLNLKSFEERSAFSTWLYRIAHNQCLNYLDKRKREVLGMKNYVAEQQVQPEITPSDSFSDLMQEALNQLNEEQRSMLILKYVMELELTEIAEIRGVTIGAVKMRLLRAREEFRRLYKPLQNAGG